MQSICMLHEPNDDANTPLAAEFKVSYHQWLLKGRDGALSGIAKLGHTALRPLRKKGKG